MTITEVLALYKAHNAPMNASTQKNYEWAVNSFVGVNGSISISFLGIDHILLWKSDMRQNGIAATSINTQLAKIRSLLRFAAEKCEANVIDFQKITREKEVYKPKTWLLPREVAKLIEA